MSEEPPRYKTFLLTVWEERNLEPHQPTVWRFGLEDPQTGQRRAFSGLEALSDALRQIISVAEATDESRPGFALPTSESSLPEERNSVSSHDEESQKRNK